MSLTYVGENVEKEPSHIAGGNATWYSHLEKLMFVKKLNINLLYKPTIPLSGFYSKK